MSQRVTRLWPPATVQKRIADLYQTLLQADAVALYLIDEARLLRAEVRGEGLDALLAAELTAGQGPVGGVAAAGQAVSLGDIAAHPRLDPAQREAAVRAHLRGWLSVAVRAGDRTLGVLTALSGQLPAFSEDDGAVATTFAAQAGIALENSRLYTELERALEGVKKSQDQLVQVERLRALAEMAAGVAHAELLLARGQAPEATESLTMIRQAAQDGAQTVGWIQEFTRTRSTRPFGRVDLQRVLQEVVDLARPRWREQAQSWGVTYEWGSREARSLPWRAPPRSFARPSSTCSTTPWTRCRRPADSPSRSPRRGAGSWSGPWTPAAGCRRRPGAACSRPSSLPRAPRATVWASPRSGDRGPPRWRDRA
ncbi:MAG TPA: GAF domain-containing protein [Candidatus Methylomirabilis sp.]|nr:GAF domain-containing protein [Candidatus Methylomirabilis sp.]